LVAEQQVTTPQKATTIKLTIDESGKLEAGDVNDGLFFYAELLDKHGNTVPINGEKIEFEAQRDIEISHANWSSTEQGKATILIKLGKSLKGAHIKAKTIGLNIQSDNKNF